jgi:aconitate hydratase A / 2-methylisocitrate dehydratase
MTPTDPLGIAEEARLGDESLTVFRLDRLRGVDAARLARQPRTTRVLLENVVRHFRPGVTDLDAVGRLLLGEKVAGTTELPFHPERILLQDFTGVPVLVDLATLRDAAASRGVEPGRIDPVVPVDLIVDHSVQVDSFGSARSFGINLDREYERNSERYRFLRWAKGAFHRLRVVPPGNGICHQVNLEHLASVVRRDDGPLGPVAFPDTLIGTDSHTTMVNGLSVLGWGVGGIEAEAVLVGEPYFLPPPRVVGVELSGSLPSGSTATDLVLHVTRRLREKGVVDRFVEFFGPGVSHLSVPDRATVSNMCPEYGATAALFPIDEATVDYLRATGRPSEVVRRVEAYARLTGLWGVPGPGAVDYDELLRIDLGAVVPTISGPRNPEESVSLEEAPASFRKALSAYRAAHPRPARTGATGPVGDGSVVIAAITSCTNTSNPSVMVGAGLIAKKAVELGLSVPPHVKTSLAPGSKVVTDYLRRAGLLEYLERLGFGLVGYGCTTCIGNSGPLPAEVERAVKEGDLFAAAVLSGNRNFEARIHNDVRANYLASPMLVVAYALAGRVDVDLSHEPLGHRPTGEAVTLRELWPDPKEVARLVASSLDPGLFQEKYRSIEVGDRHWDALDAPGGLRYPWEGGSTYLAEAPYLHLPPPWLPTNGALARGARALLVLGDRVSTDHISPAGEIAEGTAAAEYLEAHGVRPADFNTYGARRGHHEVMVRGTFANVRLRNELVGPREGGFSVHLPSGEVGTVYSVAERYRREQVPLLVLAGKSYGQGSSRDWAAKGPRLLGVGAVLAESYERIHRSNLVEMGVLPLEFPAGEGWRQLGLNGRETFALEIGRGSSFGPGGSVRVTAHRDKGDLLSFEATIRLASPVEQAHYLAGGVLPYVMAHRFTA